MMPERHVVIHYKIYKQLSLRANYGSILIKKQPLLLNVSSIYAAPYSNRQAYL